MLLFIQPQEACHRETGDGGHRQGDPASAEAEYPAPGDKASHVAPQIGADQPDEQILRLSDSFPKGADSDIEVKVRMLNVNSGRNQRLLETCKPLGEYSWLVEEIRKNNKTKDQEGAGSAIDLAISEMPDSFIIKPFLVAHKAEVKGMLLTEYNEAEQMELFKEDGRREGRVEGILDTLASLVKDGILSIKDAAARAGVSEDIIKKKIGAK